jgi:hypothetical protein
MSERRGEERRGCERVERWVQFNKQIYQGNRGN